MDEAWRRFAQERIKASGLENYRKSVETLEALSASTPTHASIRGLLAEAHSRVANFNRQSQSPAKTNVTIHIFKTSITVLIAAMAVSGQTSIRTDVWEPFKYFVGKWEGTGNGKSGISKVLRDYRLVMNGNYLQVQNQSEYAPQPKNPKGESHEDWSLISFDKSRKQFVLRQFHVEGFVNQYVTTEISADGKTIVFTTESIENIPAGWRARETYKIVSADEFVEVFELSEPGKEFEVYTENRLRRKK